QGVAYLGDGTMVVVDQGKKALGRTIEVTVTSVLQTTAGKMIFCRWAESGAAPEGEARRDARPPERRDDRRDARGNGRERPREVRARSGSLSGGPEPPAAPAAGGLATTVSAGEPGTKAE